MIFTAKHGTQFEVSSKGYVTIDRPARPGTLAVIDLRDVLEFVDQVERRECGPVEKPLSERVKLLAMMAATMAERAGGSAPDLAQDARTMLAEIEKSNS